MIIGKCKVCGDADGMPCTLDECSFRSKTEPASAEQAGGDERDLQGAQGERDGWGPFPIVQVPWNVFDRAVMWVEDRRRYGDDGTIVDDWKALKTIQRAALAQPSPAQAEKAEAERPEVVGSAWRNIYNNGFDHVAPFPPAPGGPVVDEPLMTVAQHERIVAGIRRRSPDEAEDAMRHHLSEILISLPKLALARSEFFAE